MRRRNLPLSIGTYYAKINKSRSTSQLTYRDLCDAYMHYYLRYEAAIGPASKKYYRMYLKFFEVRFQEYYITGEIRRFDIPCSVCKYFIKKYIPCAPRFYIGSIIEVGTEAMFLKRYRADAKRASELFHILGKLELIL